jgi:hypothetical protein
MRKLVTTGDNKKTYCHPTGIFAELATEAEVGGGQDMVEEPQDIPLKMST